MKLRVYFLTLLCVVLLAPMAGAQTIAIRAGAVIHPESGKVDANQIILVEGGKIVAIGSDIEIPSGTEVIDLSSSTLMPGLFDMHTHLCMNVRPENYRRSHHCSIRWAVPSSARPPGSG